MKLIRRLDAMRDGEGSMPVERHFAKQYLLIHRDHALAQNHWERTVVLRAKTQECPDDSRHVECCEIHAIAVLLPLAFQAKCPECPNGGELG